MLFNFNYRCDFDCLHYNETIECTGFIQASEVAHRLCAIILEHKENVHSKTVENTTVDTVEVTVNDEHYGTMTYKQIQPTPLRTANDIAEQWRTMLGLN